MSTRKIAATASAGVVAAAVMVAAPTVQKWEGIWTTARVDTIGTGRPVTYCYGQTDEFGRVRIGQHFTVDQCKDMLLQSLPKYVTGVVSCLTVEVSPTTLAALGSTAYNAGVGAVCRSSVVQRINDGDVAGGCRLLATWRVTSQGVVRRGLQRRRADESALCLAGVTAPKPATKSLWNWK